MGTAIKSDYIAKDSFAGDNTGFSLELEEDTLHFIEHFGAAKLGDDEVVREERITEGL